MGAGIALGQAYIDLTETAMRDRGGATDGEAIYPDCCGTFRAVEIGGLSAGELLERLARNRIEINKGGRVLLESELFTAVPEQKTLRTIELAVRQVGLANGGSLADIFAAAMNLELKLCPVELAPHLRLQYLDQPEGFVGQPIWERRTPPGSLVVASPPLSLDDVFPKGFYLRRILGTLWLRGYWCDQVHQHDPDDRFLFALV